MAHLWEIGVLHPAEWTLNALMKLSCHNCKKYGYGKYKSKQVTPHCELH